MSRKVTDAEDISKDAQEQQPTQKSNLDILLETGRVTLTSADKDALIEEGESMLKALPEGSRWERLPIYMNKEGIYVQLYRLYSNGTN